MPNHTAPLRILLASASPARLSTLQMAGIEADTRVSKIDEDAVLSAATITSEHSLDPEEQVIILARAKAEDVALALLEEYDAAAPLSAAEEAARHGSVDPAAQAPSSGKLRRGEDDDETRPPPSWDLPDFVLGCDSLLELDGAIMGKPANASQARDRWLQMRGRTGVLHTGHWLMDLRGSGRKVVAEGATSSTRVHFAHLSEAEIDAYLATSEPLRVAGAFTVDGYGGPYVTRIEGDNHGVVGLSLPVLRDLLSTRGVMIHELWSTT